MRRVEYEPMVEPYGQPYKPYTVWEKALGITKAYLEHYPRRKMVVRYLYYRGVAKEILEFGAKTYDHFIRAITRARKDFNNPEYDIFRNNIIDETRPYQEEVFYRESSNDEAIMRYLKGAFTFHHHLDPWDKRVEVWWGKNTIYQMYKDLPEKFRLSSYSLHGNLTFNVARDAYERLKDEERPIVILFVDDLNPAGDRRTYNIKAALADQGVKAEVYKVLVNPEHVRRYNLIPSVEIYGARLEKAKQDPCRNWFERLHGELYNVDVEAMEIEQVEGLLEGAIKSVLDVSRLEKIKKKEVEQIPAEVKRTKNGYRVKLL